MKQIYIEKQAKDQVHQNFRNTNSKVHCLLIRVRPNSDFLNIFLIQNKGKGPPGDILHPDHPPDGEAVLKASTQVIQCHPELVSGSFQDPNFIDVRPRNKFGVTNSDFNQILNTEIQINYINQNSNSLQTLIFTIMKKQILFLAFFVLAVLASITDTYGQMKPSSFTPQPLTNCGDYPLHPLPGKEYQYEVSSTLGDPVTSYTWWATKEINFLTSTSTANFSNMLNTGAGELLGHSPNYGVATAALTGSTVSITWTPEILARTKYQGTVGTDPSPTFVVVKADGDCTNNLQVYELDPLRAFTLDILNWDPKTNATLNYGGTSSSCVDIVRSATYDNTTKTVLMDYGTNTITFEVIAANFVTEWTPLFTITAGLTASQTATMGWAYTQADAEAGNFIDDSGATPLVVGDTFSGTTAATTTETSTVNGVSIWVSVIIDNNSYESLAVQPFTLAVDGIDKTGQWDLTTACGSANASDTDDKATQDLLPRPTVNDNTVDPGPTPDTFIDKR